MDMNVAKHYMAWHGMVSVMHVFVLGLLEANDLKAMASRGCSEASTS